MKIAALVVDNGKTERHPRSRMMTDVFGRIAPATVTILASPPTSLDGAARNTLVLLDDESWSGRWRIYNGGWPDLPAWALGFPGLCYILGARAINPAPEMGKVAREIRDDFLNRLFLPPSAQYMSER